MFCLNCTVCWYYNIVISGKILRSVRQKLIAISGISLYRRSLYRGSVPYILLRRLPGHSIFIVIPGIYISKIVLSGFHCAFPIFGIVTQKDVSLTLYKTGLFPGQQSEKWPTHWIFQSSDCHSIVLIKLFIIHTAYREYKSFRSLGGKGARTRQRELALTTETELLLVWKGRL